MKRDKTLEKVNKTINDVFNSFVLKEESKQPKENKMETIRISSGLTLGSDIQLTKAVATYNKRPRESKGKDKDVMVKLPIQTILALSRLHHYATNPMLGKEVVIVK